MKPEKISMPSGGTATVRLLANGAGMFPFFKPFAKTAVAHIPATGTTKELYRREMKKAAHNQAVMDKYGLSPMDIAAALGNK